MTGEQAATVSIHFVVVRPGLHTLVYSRALVRNVKEWEMDRRGQPAFYYVLKSLSFLRYPKIVDK